MANFLTSLLRFSRRSLCLSIALFPAISAFAQDPTLNSVSPSSGLEIGGTFLTLSGTNLDAVDSVLIGGVPAENVVVVDAFTVLCNTPSGSPGIVEVLASSPTQDAQLANAFTYHPALATQGFAVELDGVDDIVTWGNITALTTHTIELWVMVADLTTNAVIVGQLSGPSDWCGHGLSLVSANGLYYHDVDPSGCGTGGYLSGGSVQVGNWVHLAATYDGSDQRLYVDGELVSQTTGNVIGPSSWLMAGAVQFANGTQQAFHGGIDEVRLWNHPRSPHQILDGMSRRINASEPGLIGYWSFDEGSGQTVADSSPSGFDGWLGSGGGSDSRDPAWILSGAPIWKSAAGEVTSFCAGDGSGTACPCGNAGTNGHGCGSSSKPEGSLLSLTGWPSVSQGNPTLKVNGTEPNRFGLFFQALNVANSGQGSVLGDGLLCAVGATMRLEVAQADASGFAQSTSPIASVGNVSAGDTLRYQWWFRDSPQASCGTGFNLSNGLVLNWMP
ncbi:MAG: hypothetical protein ACI8X5_004192 [Planctomycetota bacterium]|jgi:hypothetical protein